MRNKNEVKSGNASYVLALITLLLWAGAVSAQTTAFTYQGRLTDSGNPANGNYDLQFALFDSLSAGTQIGSTTTQSNVAVSGGVFSVSLDFGVNAFPGANRFLEIALQPSGGGSFTTLSPRQQISSTPYAIRTLSATQADGLSGACVNCVQDAQINSIAGSKVTGTIPVGSVPTGSGNYIQNTSSPQASANFNISGTGTAASINVNGPVSVGGIAPPATAPAGQGRIYFDSSSNKVKVSENGGAFVNLVGAGGVSGSGTTNNIPLWSAGTTLGNSFITQTGNNVGVGTTLPLHRLGISGGPPWTADFWGGAIDLENASAIGWRGNSSGFRFGIGHTNAGLAFFRTGNELGNTGAAPSYDFVINNSGDVGIGTSGLAPSLNAKLQVEGGGGPLTAIIGNSGGGFGVKGHSQGQYGVYGSSDSSVGVFGYSESAQGLYGESNSGVGVFALSFSGNLVEGANASGNRQFHISNNGTYVAGSDFAEALPARGDRAGYEPGDVLVVSAKAPGHVEKASRPYDARVAGVYSTRPGMLGADKQGTSRVDADEVPVAIVGIVLTKVSTENGPIKIGDLLTTSRTPGYAMRCGNRLKCIGAIVGKAMEPLKDGKGISKVLVTLR